MSTSDRRFITVNRRRFLATSALGAAGLMGGALSSLAPNLFAGSARERKKTLVVVYLRGGADALNVIIPYKDELYFKYRPEISIAIAPEPGEIPLIPLDERFGMHPSLKPLQPFWAKGTFAPIVCTGSPHATRSHFDAQDFMEYAAPGLRTCKDGWLNRYLDATKSKGQDGALRAVALQRLLPRALRGAYPALAVTDRKSDDMEAVFDTFDPLYGGGEPGMDGAGMEPPRAEDGQAVQVGRETIDRMRKLYEIIGSDTTSPEAVKIYDRGELSRRLARLAQIIKADVGCEVACVDVGGWDHHINEGASNGAIGRDLAQVAHGLAGFATDLGDRLQDVLVLVMTEFGRTVHENGNRGTDHGHGSFMLALGGRVDGGKVHGRWPGLDEKQLYEGRDLQVTTDFRTIFDEALTVFQGFSPRDGFFPKYDRQKPIKLLKA